MSLLSLQTQPQPGLASSHGRAGARHIYNSLLGEHGKSLGTIDEVTRSTSRSFLTHLLDAAARLESDMPTDPRLLAEWLARGHEQTARAYREYLDERQAGAPRRFFRNRSHGLHFLKSVAPTKLVDGAWLYGMLPRWADPRLAALIGIYLEELGDGVAAQHHVRLYKQLLAQHGCEQHEPLGDDHYVQGAIQLSLAHHAAELLPEIIGFNLGYEQLPLHLPITAYELNELGIDPYYFSLHVTIDNASTGHARKALRCALDCLPKIGDGTAFYRRLMTGFKLNNLGLGTVDAIAAFDLEQELTTVLADKARIGAQLHSDYCRIGGGTVTEWLVKPGGMPQFLAALVTAGWIRRGADPDESRFWRLLNDEKAPMFGVFDGYEKQLIHDWIVDTDTASAAQGAAKPPRARRFRSHPAAPRAHAAARPCPWPASVAEVIRHHLADIPAHADEDVEVLRERLCCVTEKDEAMTALQGFLSPANHPSEVGLLATRICSGLMAR